MTLSDNPIAASYLYLLEPEIRFLEAAVEHLIPTDELGPGACDAGVVVYIDRALASTWGVHGRQYPGGPSGHYRELIASQEPYRAEPVSVLDIQTGKVPLDAEGFPKHVTVKSNS